MSLQFGFGELMGGLPEATLLLASTGEVVAANAAMEKMVGADAGTLAGQALAHLVEASDEEVRALVAGWSRSRQPTPAMLRLHRAEASPLPCRCSGALARPAEGPAPALLLVRVQPKENAVAQFALLNRKLEELNREIYARRQAEEELRVLNAHLEAEVLQRTRELQNANTELRRSNHDLHEFASVAGHDLQEPLRKVIAFADLLAQHLRGSADHETRLYLERIDGAARRMSHLITALLELSRLSTRKRQYAATDLNQIAEEVVLDLETRLRQSAGQVVVAPLPTLRADPMQMRQLFQNLIGNALKFHRADVPPRVEVRGHVEGAGEETCVLTFEDNGIGFEPQHGERIFAPFQRLHTRAEFEGTGMGLAICRRIAERHGGRISVESTPGVGSRFVVRLPTRPRAGVNGADEPAPLPG